MCVQIFLYTNQRLQQKHFGNYLRQNKHGRKRLVLLRDFNINLLAFKENKEVKTFVDILQNNLITPTINLSTRITAQSSTNIDNILMSSFDSKNLCWKPFSRFSDHCH